MDAAEPTRRRKIAVVGAGISGLSCAWALRDAHDITVFERDDRAGGHSNTVRIPGPNGSRLAVDTGFIVFNEPAYPNFTALLKHLQVATVPTDMSFGVTLDHGALEYGSTDLRGLFAQKRNLIRPRFWRMLAELIRFYRIAPKALDQMDDGLTLGAWLDRHGPFGVLQDDHLMPMAAAIWSCPTASVRDYPAKAFIRFCVNHGLMQVTGRPVWRTIEGGSQTYVNKLLGQLTGQLTGTMRLRQHVRTVRPTDDGVALTNGDGETEIFDDIVLASHAPDALALLSDRSPAARSVLQAFGTTLNRAVLHRDASFMPSRRAVWSAWNVAGRSGSAPGAPCVTYWMNRLQKLPGPDVFVTLNPPREPKQILGSQYYAHPLFDRAALEAQRDIWRLQGQNGIWFAGAWLGSGFHEDGLQAGLAVAEALGGVRRPWTVPDESGRMPGPLMARMAA